MQLCDLVFQDFVHCHDRIEENYIVHDSYEINRTEAVPRQRGFTFESLRMDRRR